MQIDPQVGWDLASVEYRPDLITKLTAVYILVSGVVFAFRSASLIFALWRSKNARKTLPPEQAEQRLTTDRGRMSVAQTSLTSWSLLSLLVLLLYTATEGADLFMLISQQKRVGASALAGSLSNILHMWEAGLWLLIAFCIGGWFLTKRLRQGTVELPIANR